MEKLNGSTTTRPTLIFKDPNVAKHMSCLHDKYVVVPADKAPNNIVFVCKSHYIDCLIKELTIHLATLHIPRRQATKEEIFAKLFCVPFGISTKDEELDLPPLYWIPKLRQFSCKQSYIAGSAN